MNNHFRIFFFILLLLAGIDNALAADRLLFSGHEKRLSLPYKKNLPASQILIKAHIVNIDRNYTQELGIHFNTVNNSLKTSNGFNINLPLDANPGDFILPIASFSQGLLLQMTLNALEKSGHAEVISDPQLVTLNKKPAIIEAGQEVPYQESTESGGTSVTFKKAVLRLEVTPEVQGKDILLHLIINQDQVSDLSVNGVPAINTQQLKTEVRIRNRNTVVLGGVLQENRSNQHQRVPFLSKIPILGALFRYQKQDAERKQMLIFVTPVILS